LNQTEILWRHGDVLNLNVFLKLIRLILLPKSSLKSIRFMFLVHYSLIDEIVRVTICQMIVIYKEHSLCMVAPSKVC